MQKANALPLTPDDRSQLEAWARSKTIPVRVMERSRILLLLADGVGIRPTADQLQMGYNTVRRWRDRVLEAGCPGIEHDALGRGRKPGITAERKAEIVRMTTQEKPDNATHWSLSRMAKATGLSTFAVWKIWKANGLKPHLVRTFKVSKDPHFSEKVEDIVGLYLNPPEYAVVFSVDEKTQILRGTHASPGVCSLDFSSGPIIPCRWLRNRSFRCPGFAPTHFGSPGQAPTHTFASNFPSSQAAGGKSEAFAVLQTAEHPVIRPVQSGAISTGA